MSFVGLHMLSRQPGQMKLPTYRRTQGGFAGGAGATRAAGPPCAQNDLRGWLVQPPHCSSLVWNENEMTACCRPTSTFQCRCWDTRRPTIDDGVRQTVLAEAIAARVARAPLLRDRLVLPVGIQLRPSRYAQQALPEHAQHQPRAIFGSTGSLFWVGSFILKSLRRR